MLNVKRRQWWIFALAGLLFLLAFVINDGVELLVGITPPVMAASGSAASVKNDCTNAHHGPTFGGAVILETNEVECGSVTTFGGTVAINGEVRGDLVAFGSAVVIAGTVDGKIEMYGGSLILQSGSSIHGDIQLYGSRWTQGLNVQLGGPVVDHTKQPYLLFTERSGFYFPFWPLLIWLLLGVLLTSLLPEHVMLVRTTVVSKARRSLVIGLLSILLAPPVEVVLIALVLSIPLAIIVGLGLIAAWALGTVAIGWLMGDYILRRVAPHRNTRLMQIVVGLTVLVLAGSLPYIGWLISIGAGLLGLGAVFLSRFGTRLYTQPKQPLTL